MRANVVLELIKSEREYVKHLKDVVEGYLYPARRHPEIFTAERINTIFSNIEQLYEFQRKFLDSLETCIDWSDLANSQVGNCFLQYENGFSVYHYYCNNHPNASSELQELYTKPSFVKFFEACRLLQNMIDISLDGFLLTPIQKICKYPLQLKELIKNTDKDHADYLPVENALESMKNCANLANERKRRIEALADVMSFQERVENWFGPRLNETSSILIHDGEVMKMTSSNWSQSLQLYLFDHLLLWARKDLLKRNTLILRGRISMDTITEIADADEYKGKKSFKLFCSEQEKWFVFSTRTENDKDEWIRAFERERGLVEADEVEGFQITDKEITIARRTLQSRKHCGSARYPRPRRPDTSVIDQIDLDDANAIMNRTLSLPSCIHPSHVMNFCEDSRVVSSNRAKKTTSPNSTLVRNPRSRILQHQRQQQQNTNPDLDVSIGSSLASDTEKSQSTQSPKQTESHTQSSSQINEGVGWFRKMGSKKLSRSQVYNINGNTGSRSVSLIRSSGSSAFTKSSANLPANSTIGTFVDINTQTAAAKYDKLEKRHREHMSSDEQARLLRLNNDFHTGFSSTTSSPALATITKQSSPNISNQKTLDMLKPLSDQLDRSLKLTPSPQTRKSRKPVTEHQKSDTESCGSPALGSPTYEGTVVLASGRVVRVREDAV